MEETAKMIPNIARGLKKSNYFLTQYLTGHDNCGIYLKKFKMTEDSRCRDCKNFEDDSDYTFIKCENSEHIRKKTQYHCRKFRGMSTR